MTTYVGLVTPGGNALVDGTGKWLILAVEPIPPVSSTATAFGIGTALGQTGLNHDAVAIAFGFGNAIGAGRAIGGPPPAVPLAGKYVPTTWPSAAKPFKYS